MQAIDLYQLTRVEDCKSFSLYEKHLSGRSKIKDAKLHEIKSVIQLVDELVKNEISTDGINNFYYQYEIPQIGKEFDLLRISENLVINIELKSRDVGIEKILKQLIQNKSYLAHLSRKMICITFISSHKIFYYLTDDNRLQAIDVKEVVEFLQKQTNCFCVDIDGLFRVSDFLVSPLNTPDKFIKNEYFLTPQQEDNKKIILTEIDSYPAQYKFFGITGGPGTGKTLALYDIAYHFVQKSNEKVCIIHCGMLCNGHSILNQYGKKMDIFPAKELSRIVLSNYRYVFVDESHRFYDNQFEELVREVKEKNIVCIFAYDQKQVLSKAETKRDITGRILKLPNFREVNLSNKIRTNKEIASFIRRLLDMKHTDIQPAYPSVSVVFVNNNNEAKYFIESFESKQYTFINYTKSRYYKGSFDDYYSCSNTHEVIGQEFNNVLMLMDDTFSYSSAGKLTASEHPNPDYLYSKLLFQGLTRVREKLAIIVVKNENVFNNIMEILN